MSIAESFTDSQRVVLIGDSTIDNIVWVQNELEKSVPQMIRTSLPAKVVLNYAADGFTSGDVLNGASPNISYQSRWEAGDPFPTLTDGIFKPLEHLAKAENVSHAVLSIGGNDVREILGRMAMLQERMLDFKLNYPVILDEILKVTKKVVIMLQYRPCLKTDSKHYRVYFAMKSFSGQDPVQTLNALMETIYPFVFDLARTHNLPLIDLPNTFNINDESLYCSQIEPSEKGGKIIADLISHVIQNHDFNGPSLFYRQTPEGSIETTPNTDSSSWSVGDNNLMKLGIKQYMAQALSLDEDNSPPPPPQPQQQAPPTLLANQNMEGKIQKFIDMGFANRSSIIRALTMFSESEEAVVNYLLENP
eukprot:TRINITY_DN12278_c0_g1_i1.p1 TRINITY_DN12278_c0_g1~~TRINITY_DN12278_c0_g1_i1.p1  ORF type:complete len:362 (-),score=75.99 TRINITY_DN12278_c0_g1_i1:90-1175(-)